MVVRTKVVSLGTLRVKAFEMIMGVSEEIVREHYSVDDAGYMRIGMNALVVEMNNRLLVIDPGTATFLSKSLAELYDLKMDKSLANAFAAEGYPVDEVTDVLFTHLHFDHGSGGFERVQGGIVKAFPNARYIFYDQQLEEIRSLPSEESGSYFHKLIRFAGEYGNFDAGEFGGMEFYISHGHAGHMIVPIVHAEGYDVLFTTDLCPMKLQIKPGAWSYYDLDKDLLQIEKKQVFGALRRPVEVVYYHEPVHKPELYEPAWYN